MARICFLLLFYGASLLVASNAASSWTTGLNQATNNNNNNANENDVDEYDDDDEKYDENSNKQVHRYDNDDKYKSDERSKANSFKRPQPGKKKPKVIKPPTSGLLNQRKKKKRKQTGSFWQDFGQPALDSVKPLFKSSSSTTGKNNNKRRRRRQGRTFTRRSRQKRAKNKTTTPTKQIPMRISGTTNVEYFSNQGIAIKPIVGGMVGIFTSKTTKFSIVMLLLVELLDRRGVPLGMKDDDRPTDVSTTNWNDWYKKARNRVGGILNRNTYSNYNTFQQALRTWQPKHKFALGASLGFFVVTEFFGHVAKPMLLGSIIVYLCSELNHVIRIASRSPAELLGIYRVEWGLDSLRYFVRDVLDNPNDFWDAFSDFTNEYMAPIADTGVRIGLLTGFVVGATFGV